KFYVFAFRILKAVPAKFSQHHSDVVLAATLVRFLYKLSACHLELLKVFDNDLLHAGCVDLVRQPVTAQKEDIILMGLYPGGNGIDLILGAKCLQDNVLKSVC